MTELNIVDEEVTAMINLCNEADASQGPILKWVLKAALEGINKEALETGDEALIDKYCALENLQAYLMRGRHDLLRKFHALYIKEFSELGLSSLDKFLEERRK